MNLEVLANIRLKTPKQLGDKHASRLVWQVACFAQVPHASSCLPGPGAAWSC